MSRYIDADALIKELEREVDLADDWKTAHEIFNTVKYFPTFDVRENVRGEWISLDGYRCSRCNYKLQTTGIPSFCPNCGADMRGENDE